MGIATITPVLIPAVAATHHPYSGVGVGGTRSGSLPHEFLTIAVRLTNIHQTTSKRSGISLSIIRRPERLKVNEKQRVSGGCMLLLCSCLLLPLYVFLRGQFAYEYTEELGDKHQIS